MTAPDEDMSRLTALRLLVGLCVLNLAVAVMAHAQMPLPPHSSHDGFLLVPQLQHLLLGATPDNAQFGMFAPTWFSPHALGGWTAGWDGFFARVVGNVQSHTWIDAPHPLALAAAAATVLPGGSLIPALVLAGYLLVLLVALYDIGAETVSRRVGLLAVTIATGCPALFGTARYIESHLPIAAMSTLVVALLVRTRGLRCVWACVAASFAMWSLSRTGEGSGDAVIAGLLVIGPALVVLLQSDRSLPGGRWLLGFLGLSVPFILLADLPWMVDAMERVTRAFEDPAVQTDVVEKGGFLSHPLAWMGSYIVLIATDYFRPILALSVPVGLWGLRHARVNRRWLLALWLVVPFLALSWMQRKASWYGIGLVPPLALWVAIGIDAINLPWLRRSVVAVALGQFLVFSFVPERSFPDGLSLLRDPVPIHDWRLRRIDLLRPMDSASDHRVEADLDRVVFWMRERKEKRPIALVTMGSRHDYAARYHLSMQLPGVEVINLTDPRVRRARYRSLQPDDFGLFLFLDDGLSTWPPDEVQMEWLKTNLRCADADPMGPFLHAVTQRGMVEQSGFHVLTSTVGGRLEAGQIWSGLDKQEAVNNGLCGG